MTKLACLGVTLMYLAALSLAIPSAQSPAIDLTGTWKGTGSDFWVSRNAVDGMTVTWVLTQTGATVSGTVTSAGLNPTDGSCSSCHRAKGGTVSGSVAGTALTLTMEFPGRLDEITPTCSVSFNGTAGSIADPTFTTLYTLVDSCEGAFTNGSLTMTREANTPPSITSQPSNQLIPIGQSATLTVTGTGTAPLSYQWFRGTSGNTSDPIGGAAFLSYTPPPPAIATDYWVRVSNASGITVNSVTARLTPYQPFADDILTAGASVVRAVHIVELRTRVDAVRVRLGLAAYPYAEPALTAGGTSIRAQHLADLRAALTDAYLAAGRTPPTYTDAGLAPGHLIRAVHIAELRTALALIE